MQDVKTKVSFSHDYDEERGFHIATIHVEGRLGKLAKLLDDLNQKVVMPLAEQFDPDGEEGK